MSVASVAVALLSPSLGERSRWGQRSCRSSNTSKLGELEGNEGEISERERSGGGEEGRRRGREDVGEGRGVLVFSFHLLFSGFSEHFLQPVFRIMKAGGGEQPDGTTNKFVALLYFYTHPSIRSVADTEMTCALVSDMMAWVSRDLPTPAGPYSNTPWGNHSPVACENIVTYQ